MQAIKITITHTISKMASPTLRRNDRALLVQCELRVVALIRQIFESRGLPTNTYGVIIDQMFKFGMIKLNSRGDAIDAEVNAMLMWPNSHILRHNE